MFTTLLVAVGEADDPGNPGVSGASRSGWERLRTPHHRTITRNIGQDRRAQPAQLYRRRCFHPVRAVSEQRS